MQTVRYRRPRSRSADTVGAIVEGIVSIAVLLLLFVTFPLLLWLVAQ